MNKKIHVVEEHFSIDCVLNNGSWHTKWGCERMLDETLHQHPERFRAIFVPLGAIAGSEVAATGLQGSVLCTREP
jgi:hypothetical protein